MDIREGEKVSGVVKAITEKGYSVALCNDIKGFVPNDNLADGVDPSDLKKGSEVKVRVDKRTDGGHLKLTLIKLFTADKFQKKPDKYLKNVSHEKQNEGDTLAKPKVAEEFQEWVAEIDRTFQEISQNRKERLNEDFLTI